MSLILIATESTSPSRHYRNLGERLREFRVGDDCHVMQNIWIMNSTLDPREIHGILNNIIHPDDRYIVGPLSGPWISHNCRDADDCFRF
jgi:hypothetical protein